MNNDGDITINATLIMLRYWKNFWKIFQGQMEKTLKEMRLWSKVTLFHKDPPNAMFSDAELEETRGAAKKWTGIIPGFLGAVLAPADFNIRLQQWAV